MEAPEGASVNGEAGSPLPAWKGRRAVLRAGFGCVIALLVFSTIEAYRIQASVAEQHVGMYKHYFAQEEALAQLRRNILLGSTYVRDFFMSAQPDRVEVYRKQIWDLQAQNRQALALLDDLKSSGRGRISPRNIVENYWRTLEPVEDTMEHVKPSSAYDFIQREVVPPRSAAYQALRQLTDLNQAEMQRNDLEFAHERRAALQRLAVLLGVCVILGVLVAWWTLRHSEILSRTMERQYGEVAQAKRALQQLSARLLDIQEEERRRLSRGLHDEIGQTLTALRIEISNALQKSSSPEVRERLERARLLAERTVQTVRDISLLLRPALLDDLGLIPALQWQIEDFSRRSGVPCEFHETELPDNLPDPVKTCVYRVVQEALHNCEKHARASRAEVLLHPGRGRLIVDVRDDGRGFELGNDGMPLHGEGLGLLGMRERAVRLGGQLVFESAPGQGTRVCLDIPVPECMPQDQAAGAALGD